MRLIFACLSFLAFTALPAGAQTPTDPLLEGRARLAETGETILVPEEARLQPVTLLGAGRLELTLDSGLGLKSIRAEAMPDKPGILTSQPPATEETLERVPNPPALTNRPGTIAFTLFLDGGETFLHIENNSDRPIAYVAVLFRGRGDNMQMRPTETCTVARHRQTVESWPYPVDGINITQFLSPPEDNGRVMCLDPTDDIDNPRWYALDHQ